MFCHLFATGLALKTVTIGKSMGYRRSFGKWENPLTSKLKSPFLAKRAFFIAKTAFFDKTLLAHEA